MKHLKSALFRVIAFFALVAITFISCKKDSASSTTTPATPVVTNVQPKNPMPGDIVTITGTGFGAKATDVKVTIGSQTVTINTVSDTEIKFTLTAGLTAGDIAVAIKGIVAKNTDPQKATITPKIPAPTAATITSINPTSGKAGDVISILGTGFSTIASDNVVKFNGVTAIVTGSVTSVLTVTVPAGVSTGAVTVSVKNASIVTGPIFTVNSTTGGTGTAVPYIVVNAGTATFAKIATAPAEIGAMIVDKVNNVLYYSDFTAQVSNHNGTIYKLKLDGSAPTVLSTDNKVTKIVSLGVDATGNVYAAASLDALGGVQANILKIDPKTGSVTTIANNLNYRGQSNAFNIDSQGGLWFGYSQKYNTTTNAIDQVPPFTYTSYHNANSQTDNIYLDNVQSKDINFYKFNLLTRTATVTDFTLSSIFKQDDPALANNVASIGTQMRYAIDGNDNFYAIYPIPGTAANSYLKTYAIRKTKNGNAGASTLISNFNTKQYSITSQVVYQDPDQFTGLTLQADASGNLYFKGNATDIVKVTP